MDLMPYPDTLAARAELCRSVILSAGELVLKGFQGEATRSFSMKGPQDFLTVTDAASEAHIRGAISACFPKDSFFGEEGGGVIGDRVWVVDPVDGTANFARGIPHFCISIAYVENGQTEIGAIYNPALNELYFARRGEGATRNGQPIQVAQTERFDAASIEMGWSTRIANATYLDVVKNLLDMGTNVRRAGSGALALAYVADGRSDAYLELHMNSWDCLAGLLLVSEAGGDVCPFLEIGSLEDGGPVLAAASGVASGVSRASKIPLAERQPSDRQRAVSA
ncbi:MULTISPECIES: inositol monophosphatase family protein [Agrobacterium]|jgi:myo-inositol-1(or 4)-monophosphatase|uniref:inositol monophosphatase family protein n=1 Tax=Agrobacterium TaxID=357 RepID=UPI000360994C|nr:MULTISPECIES: inositol monophosphatase family protein [Agrobacterium]KAA3499688.1 inositol monophosphatase [Agrobacterium tumefaciens]MBO9111261.1 inositol monophosphatase [Agrobacterium sp. S2/73]MDP9757696.1 myo-inositol-1(or 4)-monophosphatase [Agrobacterium tumefaciens]MDQ1218936.1 myo-inositol-1(or 4)-monophosphatase [Agrobacterium sp. SORGH_AS_0745]MDR5011208.1 inositol monophosphatase family protein [Agrobacterium tumefaciens]